MFSEFVSNAISFSIWDLVRFGVLDSSDFGVDNSPERPETIRRGDNSDLANQKFKKFSLFRVSELFVDASNPRHDHFSSINDRSLALVD